MVALNNVHADVIHDAELDYYGRRLATCSSDRTIKILEVADGDKGHRLLDTLKGHDGPVWQVAWSHPKFGAASKSGLAAAGAASTGLLASCGYDGRVVVWRQENGSFRQFGVFNEHQASVNSIQWAPVELGPLLLCGSSDGRVSVLEIELDQPASGSVSGGVVQRALFAAHQIGTNAVSWAPYEESEKQVRRFVSGGGDNLVKIWRSEGDDHSYELEAALDGHTDWVRDVAWSPSMLSQSYIASGSQDKTVVIWTQTDKTRAGNSTEGAKQWKKTVLKAEPFPDVVWRLSWSLSGNILAVSGGDNKVSLWKEGLDGTWEQTAEVDEQTQ